MEELYTVDEFAALVRVDPATVRRWAKSRRIQAAKMGKSWRIAKSEVQRVLSEGVAPEVVTPAHGAERATNRTEE